MHGDMRDASNAQYPRGDSTRRLQPNIDERIDCRDGKNSTRRDPRIADHLDVTGPETSPRGCPRQARRQDEQREERDQSEGA